MQSPLDGRPQTLTDLVHSWIRNAIVTGVLVPGERITEANVAQQLDVSKTPVRESFLRLREIGLLEDDGRRGHRVVRSTQAAVDDALQLRLLLEPFVARTAAELADDESRSAIMAIAERCRQIALEEQPEIAHQEADLEFHELIAATAGNSQITKAIGDAIALMRVISPQISDPASFDAIRTSA